MDEAPRPALSKGKRGGASGGRQRVAPEETDLAMEVEMAPQHPVSPVRATPPSPAGSATAPPLPPPPQGGSGLGSPTGLGSMDMD